MNQAKYLADLLALQVLNTDVAHHINRGDCEALVDCFVYDATYEEDTQTSIGREAIVAWFRARSQARRAPRRYSYSAVRVIIVDPKIARGSSLRVTYLIEEPSPEPAFPPIIYDVDDVYQLERDGRWRIAGRTEKSVHL